MLINTKLPLSLDYLQKQDQTFSLSGMTWTDYEKFNSEEYLGYRVSYFNGVITLVYPNLVIEVIFSSGSIDDLEKYQAIGVKKVWFWKNNKITFYELQSEGYTEITHSNFLRNLTSEILEKFVNQGLTQSPLVIEADFLEQIPVL